MSTIRPGLAGRRAQAVSRLLWLGVVTACAAAGAPLWRYYIGVQRIVTDDHERGVTWEPFVKHKRTWQYRFQNPAQPYLDAKELYDLTPAERADFRVFCEIRCAARCGDRMRGQSGLFMKAGDNSAPCPRFGELP